MGHRHTWREDHEHTKKNREGKEALEETNPANTLILVLMASRIMRNAFLLLSVGDILLCPLQHPTVSLYDSMYEISYSPV